MTKDFKSGNIKHLPVKNVDLPNFVNNFSVDNSNICSIEGTNVIRVPFGKKFSKKKRPNWSRNMGLESSDITITKLLFRNTQRGKLV